MIKSTTAVRQLGSSKLLRDAVCELTLTRPEVLELALHLWSSGHAWKEHRINKPNGGERVILAPADPVKEFLRGVLKHVAQRLPVHRAVHGAHPGTSVVTNARRHAGFARALYVVDLKDAFPSCTPVRLERVVRPTLVRTIDESLDAGSDTAESLADILLALCVVDGGLPQGFPTSPGLLNAVLYPVDRAIGAYLREFREKGTEHRFTRYVDDITVSTNEPEITREQRRAILKRIREQGWRVNRRKVHYFGVSQEGDEERSTRAPRVTGLVIHPDGRLTIPRWRLDKWRGFLHGVSLQESVSDEDRARAAGIVGFVSMVYDEAVPSIIRRPYQAARARFGASRGHELASGEIDPLGDDGEDETQG